MSWKVVLGIISLAVLFISMQAASSFSTQGERLRAPSPLTAEVSSQGDAGTAVPSPLIKRAIQLIEAGDFHGDQVPARSGEKWLGLYANDATSELIISRLKVILVEDEINDGRGSGRKTGKGVFVDRKTEPVFLLRNAPMLQPGKAITIYQDTNNEQTHSLFSGNLSALNLNGQPYRFSFQHHCYSAEAPDQPACAELKLTDGVTTQTIFQTNDPRVWADWYLRWAGDLDLDGRLDFYLTGSDEENALKRRLFLSSAASAGTLVKQVAEFVTTGC